jgi:lysophospholipase L1-like esterase
VEHIEQWLELNADFSHFAIGYGTNDAWGNKDPVSSGFEANLNALVEAIVAAGRVPLIATIPYAEAAHDTLPQFNAAIERVRAAHGLPCGPDLYTWFKEHPDHLGADRVHPNRDGNIAINALWAEAALKLYAAD